TCRAKNSRVVEQAWVGGSTAETRAQPHASTRSIAVVGARSLLMQHPPASSKVREDDAPRPTGQDGARLGLFRPTKTGEVSGAVAIRASASRSAYRTRPSHARRWRQDRSS